MGTGHWVLGTGYWFNPPKIKIHLNKKLINEKPFKEITHYNIIN
jgi:hypothetical protein